MEMGKEIMEKLLTSGNEQLSKLNDIVLKAVEEERLLSEKLFEFEDSHPSFPNRVADRMASFGGSWKFILAFCAFMLLWMTVNIYLPQKPFDPFPFILLNLILSSIAALQAPVIMMSQNRKEERDRKRATNDYLVNLKAEIEVRNLHRKIDLLMSEQMQTLFSIQQAQVNLMEEIRSALNKKDHSKDIV
jgi:uncharacterized membrane protein